MDDTKLRVRSSCFSPQGDQAAKLDEYMQDGPLTVALGLGETFSDGRKTSACTLTLRHHLDLAPVLTHLLVTVSDR